MERAHPRIRHALVILLSMLYLQVTTTAIQSLVCVRVDVESVSEAGGALTTTTAAASSELRLLADGAVVCWSGWHLFTSIMCVLVLLVYALGFPLWSFVQLRRQRAGIIAPLSISVPHRPPPDRGRCAVLL